MSSIAEAIIFAELVSGCMDKYLELAMKRSLLAPLLAAFVIVAASACAPKPATHISPAADAPMAEIVVQRDELMEPADTPKEKNNEATEEGAKLMPADALKLMLLQLLVARN